MRKSWQKSGKKSRQEATSFVVKIGSNIVHWGEFLANHKVNIWTSIFSAGVLLITSFVGCREYFSKPIVEARIFNSILSFVESQAVITSKREMGIAGNFRLHIKNLGDAPLEKPTIELSVDDPISLSAVGSIYEIAHDKDNGRTTLTIRPGDIPPFRVRNDDSGEYERIGEMFRLKLKNPINSSQIDVRIRIRAYNHKTLTGKIVLTVQRGE